MSEVLYCELVDIACFPKLYFVVKNVIEVVYGLVIGVILDCSLNSKM